MPIQRAKEIIELTSFPNYAGVYTIGIGARQVAFLSQQERALNLIWALQQEKFLGENFKLAVVGGGLSGITAALAASLLGADVTLLEQKSDPMHLQRGSQLRYLHPYVASWPLNTTTSSCTDIPLLNWSAGNAAFVVETIMKQWNVLSGNIRKFFNHTVTTIANVDGQCILTAQNRLLPEPDKENHLTDKYDAVILATGFGTENSFQNVPILSYWENDSLSQPIIAGKIPRKYLVSGCGDGGCVDTLRLSLKDFDHGRFTEFIMSAKGLDVVKEELVQIEEDVVKVLDNFGDAGDFDDIAGQMLSERYSKIKIPPEIENEVRLSIRKDTEVLMVGSGSTPLRPSVFVFNRFAIHLLQRWGHLQYQTGKLAKVTVLEDGSYVALLEHKGFANRTVFADRVIIRHGPKSNLGEIFSNRALQNLEVSSADKARVDVSQKTLTEKHYPTDFLLHSKLKEFKQEVELRHAARNLLELCEKHATTATLMEASIVTDKTIVSYKIKDLSKSQQSETKQFKFRGVDTIVEGLATSAPISAEPRELENSCSRKESLRVGSKIFIEVDGIKHIRAINCFVKHEYDSIPTYIVFSGVESAKSGYSIFDVKTSTKIGTIRSVNSPRKMPLGSSVIDASTPTNFLDICVGILEDSVTYSPTILLNEKTQTIMGMRKPRVGINVFRSIDSMIYKAKIDAINRKGTVSSNSGAVYLFNDTFSCETQAKPGLADSLLSGATYDENCYLVGLPLGITSSQWLDASILNFWDTEFMVLCAEVDRQTAREQILLRLRQFKNGSKIRLQIQTNSSYTATDYLNIGDCYYYLDEDSRIELQWAFQELMKENLITQVTGATNFRLTPDGKDVAQALFESKQT